MRIKKKKPLNYKNILNFGSLKAELGYKAKKEKVSKKITKKEKVAKKITKKEKVAKKITKKEKRGEKNYI